MMASQQKLCLNAIVPNFEEYYSKACENYKYSKFLKIYSTELLRALSVEGKLNDDYLNFFLNDKLLFLDSRWFEDSCYRDSIQDVIRRLPNLREVCLTMLCNDEILQKIAEFCPRMIKIDASESFVTDTGVMYLCDRADGQSPCPNLKNIILENSKVTEEGVRYLIRNLRSLEVLGYKKTPQILHSMHEIDLPNLENVRTYNLISLNLKQREILGFKKRDYYYKLLKICLTVCPNLKSLKCPISHEMQLNLIKNTTKLEKLTLESYITNSKIDINNLLIDIGSNLTYLEILNCFVSINVICSHCPKLEYLDVGNVDFSDIHGFPHCMFHNLNTCRFRNTEFLGDNNKVLRLILSSTPKLECLRFRSCDLSSETESLIETCCQNNILKHITFFDTPVEFSCLKVIILTCTSLKTLYFSRITHTFRKLLSDFLKTLPKKPDVFIDKTRIEVFVESASCHYP